MDSRGPEVLVESERGLSNARTGPSEVPTAMEDRKPIPESLWSLEWISHGSTGVVFAIDDTTALKASTDDEESRRDLDIERRIYERLGRHPRFLELFYVHRRGLVLERMKDMLRLRLYNMRNARQVPTQLEVFRWASQMAEGLAYLHSKSVLQVDMGCHNLLLDDDDNIKFCDFAGSSIDGEKETVGPSSHSQIPVESVDEPHTVTAELFALGSALYEISTTLQPWPDEESREVERLFKAGTFPETTGLVLGRVIQGCWHREYSSADEVIASLKQAERLAVARQAKDAAGAVDAKDGGMSLGSGYFSALTLSSVVLVAATVMLVAHRYGRMAPASISA